MAWYPSWVVHLILRFDEALQIAIDDDALRAATESGELGRRQGEPTNVPKVTMGRAVVSGSGADPIELELPKSAAVVRARAGGPQLEPLVFPKDNMTQVMDLVPIDCTVDLQNVRQAGKFSFKLDWRNLPLDPRLVRAIGVEVHLGAVSETDFADGVAGVFDETGRRVSMIKTRINGQPNPDTMLMVGSADTARVSHGETGSIITIEGRDIRGILLDAKVPPALIAKIKLEQPISDVIRDVLETAPAEIGLNIKIVAEFPDSEPIVADGQGYANYRTSADGSKTRATGAGAEKMSYWDLITQWCFLVGAIPFFTGRDLYIRPARSIFDTQIDSETGKDRTGQPPPFRTRDGRPTVRDIPSEGGAAERVGVRRLVVGRDILVVDYDRKFGGAVVPKVKVIGTVDNVRGLDQRRVVQWPPENTLAADLKGENEEISIPIPGINSEKRLLSIAQDLYEEIGRGEMGGVATTGNLASQGGTNADPDILRMRPTDAIQILTDTRALSSRAPLMTEYIDGQRIPFDEQVARLIARGMTPSMARVLVAASRSAVVGVIDYFRVANVRFSLRTGGATSIAFDFQTYMISRHRQAYTKDPAAQAKVSEVKKKGAGKKIKPAGAKVSMGRSRSERGPSRALDGFVQANEILEGAALTRRQASRDSFARTLYAAGLSESAVEDILRDGDAAGIFDSPSPEQDASKPIGKWY